MDISLIANPDSLPQDHMVFRYIHEKLVAGYPKSISEAFPGIPDHLDAAMQCPKPVCEKNRSEEH